MDFTAEITKLKEEKRFRRLPLIEARQGPYVKINGKWLLNLSSNDYLGLSEKLSQKEILEEIKDFPIGAGAARLLSGNHLLYQRLEEKLGNLYQKKALVFSSGYHANVGIISALAGRRDVVFADKLVHASIIDGLRLSGATYFRYPHGNIEALADLLKSRRFRYKRAFIITESIFSMDGDKSPLEELIKLKRTYQAFLILDEAHAVGVYGQQGLGLAEEYGLINEIDLLLGTFGKALGGYGAFVIASEEVIDLLINKARSFIFTTALPPFILAVNLKAISLLPDLKEARSQLRKLSSWFRKNLGLSGDTPIVPIVLGDNEKALAASAKLFEAGFFVPAIRPPTVPPGTARLRVSLTSQMSEENLFSFLRLVEK
ncbi:8-amino-7-oxononanoate synthase [Thermodesulfatator indicus DSM 15286]|uniref:8-amino-7-oxononanoate synthase n=1 Tax=Thermodesulfatator indicus (strain DSM 15286 / JCM 11887 / CIR29812) TaxID=667014 RepID=F8A7Z7_THEID|nr:8-amino-7-oxononanoate synthase [Thermodesulfatator indicus]AEH43913.1 8-amino-7-oxononanoate synthase [Thermodesulfatator indicus DSM 15286]